MATTKLTPKLEELARLKAKVAELEKSITADRTAMLARLHVEVGFDSQAELIEALRLPGKARSGRGRGGSAAGSVRKRKRRRAKITPQLRKAIIGALKGGATSRATAEKFKVSQPTVQNIKRAAGLTRKTRRSK